MLQNKHDIPRYARVAFGVFSKIFSVKLAARYNEMGHTPAETPGNERCKLEGINQQ